ncbi:MAG: glutathione S-transferase [Betaproteobacteria bacterium]|jgi:glutathione S-transferase|nr:glutathione S-transferase [Betaproteobacteria bacterium]
MLKIWGRTNSVNVKKALWCAEELGLAYERIEAGREHGVVDTPEYRELNPNGLVPTIEDDGFVLWESHAIVRYLSAKHGAGALWPDDIRMRADADRWMDWTGTRLNPTMRTAFWGLVRTPLAERDAKAIAESVVRSGELLVMVDAVLASRPYIAGEHFTMGDIPLGCHVYNWMMLRIERRPLAHLEAWYERLTKRPAFQKAVMRPLS